MALPALAMAGIGAGLGALGGLLGRDPNQSTVGYQGGTNQSQTNFTPAAAASPLYGYLAGIGQQMGNIPTPYFPGQGYVSPSAPTQAAVNGWMNFAPGAANAGASLMNRAVGSGSSGGGGGGGYVYRGDSFSGAGGQSQPNWATTANFAAEGMPFFREAAEMGRQGVPYYQDAAGLDMQSANSFLGAAGAQRGLLPGANANFNFLSNAADVANNPYVQGMSDVMTRRINENLTENLLPALQGSAVGVNNLGSSRLGLAQGQAVEGSQQALSDSLAQLNMDAYNRGLSSQEFALGQTQQMLANQNMPAMSEAMAADSRAKAGSRYSEIQNLLSTAGQQYGLGAEQIGQQLSRAADARAKAEQAAAASAQAAAAGRQAEASMLRAKSDAAMTGLEMQLKTLQATLQVGGVVEGYQGAALTDAMARSGYQYDEPWQRATNIQGIINGLAPLGTNNMSGATTGANSGTNPNYQSPLGALTQGAIGGGFMGYGLGTPGSSFMGALGAAPGTSGGLYGSGGFYDQRYR